MRASQLSKPSSVPFSQSPRDLQGTNPFQTVPFPQATATIDPILSQLKVAHQQVLEARAKSKELKETIEYKETEQRRLEELHQVNQEVIVRHEKELSAQRNSKGSGDLIKQKETLEGTLKVQFDKVRKMTAAQFESLKEIGIGEVEEEHENKVVALMMSQIRLYQSQLKQRQMDLEQAIDRHTRQLRMVSEESAALSAEIKEASAARLADMKRILKLVRTEAYTAGTIRAHGLKPTDEVAAEATGEVMVRLKEKLEPMDENSEFLQSLQEKLSRRGISLELSKSNKSTSRRSSRAKELVS